METRLSLKMVWKFKSTPRECVRILYRRKFNIAAMSVRMLLCPEMILRPKVLFFQIDSINTRVCKHHIHASVKCKMKNYLLEWFVPLQCFKQWEFLDESSDECWQQSRIQICTAKNWKKRFLFHVKLPLRGTTNSERTLQCAGAKWC